MAKNETKTSWDLIADHFRNDAPQVGDAEFARIALQPIDSRDTKGGKRK